MTWDALAQGAKDRHLTLLGGFYPTSDDKVPAGTATLLLLGPDEPDFWAHLQASPEWQGDDPVDTWSRRVIGDWARELGATALFPFGGPPYQPFFSWATRTGRIHASPIQLLVHDQAGLFVSFRGALALPRRIAIPDSPAKPCDTCHDQPCRTACPVDAFDGQSYDVPACKAFLHAPEGADCMAVGCRARRACPVSQNWGRLPAQSAHHMAHFRG